LPTHGDFLPTKFGLNIKAIELIDANFSVSKKRRWASLQSKLRKTVAAKEPREHTKERETLCDLCVILRLINSYIVFENAPEHLKTIVWRFGARIFDFGRGFGEGACS
jgi:hypothetical protein